MSRLSLNALPAEVKRGCVFAERFDSSEAVVKNGGTITGSPSISNRRGSFDGSADKITYPLVSQVKSISFWITLATTTEDIMELSSSHSIEVVSGTLTATGVDTPTIYVNGVATATIGTGRSFVTITTATAFDADSFVIGADDSYGEYTIEDVKLWNVVLTAQEISDYANNSTWNYMNEAKHAFFFRPEDYDITNSQFLNRGRDGTAGEIYGTVTYNSDGGMKRTGSISMANAGYIALGSGKCSVSDGNSFSYSIMVFGDSTTDKYIFSNGTGTVGVDWMSCYVTSGAVQANIDDGSTILSTTAFTLPKGWHDITVVGTLWSTMNIYLDGELKDSLDISGLSGDCNGNSSNIGTRFNNAAYNFTGEVDSFMFWDQALTPIQIYDIVSQRGDK